MDWTNALGYVNSLFGYFTGNNATDRQEAFNERQLQFQQQENQKNRNFNAAQAQIAYNRSVEQWNRENSYNTPSAVMDRMRKAGLNPDLVATQGNTQGMASFSGSQQASSNGGISPVGSPDYNMAYKNAMEARLLDAQTRNIDADTKNKETENSILSTEAKYVEAFKKQQLDCGAVTITLNDSLARLNDAQIEETRSVITKLNHEAENLKVANDLLKKECESFDEDIISKKIKNWIDSESAQSIIDRLAAEAEISKADAQTALDRYLTEIAVGNSQIELNKANARKAKADAQLTEDNHDNILAQTAAAAALASANAQSIELSMADEKNYQEVMNSGTTFGNCLKYLGQASRAFSRIIPTIKVAAK